MERKAKIIDKDGKIKEVDLSYICGQKIVQTRLSQETLNRIKVIYDEFSPYLSTNLEQFELGFMRDDNPENEVEIWENILLTFQFAQDVFGDDEQHKKFIFECLITNVTNSFFPEEEELEIVQQLKELYTKVCAARKLADEEEKSPENL